MTIENKIIDQAVENVLLKSKELEIEVLQLQFRMSSLLKFMTQEIEDRKEELVLSLLK